MSNTALVSLNFSLCYQIGGEGYKALGKSLTIHKAVTSIDFHIVEGRATKAARRWLKVSSLTKLL